MLKNYQNDFGRSGWMRLFYLQRRSNVYFSSMSNFQQSANLLQNHRIDYWFKWTIKYQTANDNEVNAIHFQSTQHIHSSHIQSHTKSWISDEHDSIALQKHHQDHLDHQASTAAVTSAPSEHIEVIDFVQHSGYESFSYSSFFFLLLFPILLMIFLRLHTHYVFLFGEKNYISSWKMDLFK